VRSVAVHVCVDDTEPVVEDLVSMYTGHNNITDIDDSELSPSKKRHRLCLAERDSNVGELKDAGLETPHDNEAVGLVGSEISVCQSTATECGQAGSAEGLMSTSAQKHINKENYDNVADAADVSETFMSPPHRRNIFVQSKDSSVARQRFDVNATKDKPTSPAVTSDNVADAADVSETFKSPPHRRNIFAQSKDSGVARQRFDVNATKDKPTSPAVTSDNVADASKSPSETFKSPPHRCNVFAQSRDSSVARHRFNLNATKDKLTSPEPIVEVRSRSVTPLTVVGRSPTQPSGTSGSVTVRGTWFNSQSGQIICIS